MAAVTPEPVTRLIDAFAQPENRGRGVIKVSGKMAELLHLEQARRLVAISEAIQALSAPS